MATSARGERVARQFVEHDPVVERHFRYLSARVPDAWTSGFFAFGMCACCLASSAANMKYGILGFVGLTGLLFALFPHFVLKANARNAILWLYPAWTVLSTAWSIDPDRTFHSIQLVLPTIIAALALGAMPDRRAMQAGAALAMMGYIVISFVYGQSAMVMDGNAFSGIAGGKNYFGHLAAMSFLMCFAFLAFGNVERGRQIVGMAIVGWLICGVALVDSLAKGSLIAAIVSSAVFFSAVMFPRLAWPFKLTILVALIGAIILYLTYGDEIQEYLMNMLLTTFKKDRTLTGRVELWDFADRLIEQKFWLGHGFNAFWYLTNPDAWTLWRLNGVQPMSGFNFHNLFREILIDGGAIGLGLFGLSFGYRFVKTGLRALSSGAPTDALRIAFATYFVMRMGVETTGFAAVTVDTLLLFGFLCVKVDQKVVQEAGAKPEPRLVEV